jgi:S1-C subfamily serine protease
MAILIDSVLPGSLAASKGVKRGEKLLRVNGLEVRDFLDLEFYSSDYHFTLELQDSNGTIRTLDICRDDNRPLA